MHAALVLVTLTLSSAVSSTCAFSAIAIPTRRPASQQLARRTKRTMHRMVLDDFHSVSTLTMAGLELGQNQNPTVFDPTTGKEVNENFNSEFGIAQAFEWVVGIGLYVAYKNGLGGEKFQAYMDKGLKPGVKSGVSEGREIADARRAALKAEKEKAKAARR